MERNENRRREKAKKMCKKKRWRQNSKGNEEFLVREYQCKMISFLSYYWGKWHRCRRKKAYIYERGRSRSLRYFLIYLPRYISQSVLKHLANGRRRYGCQHVVFSIYLWYVLLSFYSPPHPILRQPPSRLLRILTCKRHAMRIERSSQ